MKHQQQQYQQRSEDSHNDHDNGDNGNKRVQIMLQRNPHIDTPITKVDRTNDFLWIDVCLPVYVCEW